MPNGDSGFIQADDLREDMLKKRAAGKEKARDMFDTEKTPEKDIQKRYSFDVWQMSPYSAGVKAAKQGDIPTMDSLRRSGVEGDFSPKFSNRKRHRSG